MFGKSLFSSLSTSIILGGYCLYIVRLYFNDNINLYIHPRYTIFTLVMCTIALVVLAVGICLEVKNRKNGVAKKPRIRFLDVLAVVTLALALILPARTLSPEAVGRKSLNIPTYDASSESEESCPDIKAETIQAWVYNISYYPDSCFEGNPIELTGFVYESADNPLPDNMFYLGRLAISCCVIDARPYALPVKSGDFSYPKDTWLKVTGSIKKSKVNGETQFVVSPGSIIRVSNPDKPYEYLNRPPVEEAQTLQPITQTAP